MTQRVLWLHLSMCKTCGVEREDALNIRNICFNCINHAAWCCAACSCAGCRAPLLNNSSWWLGGSTGTRHGLGGGSSPGKLATFWQLISSIATASLGSLSHRGCQGECTNIRHNEVEESFASVFWSHCHNKSGYTTWARDLCVTNSK